MNTIDELQNNQGEVNSEISFLRKEIDFLLKLLRNGYSISIEDEKIKLLDKFWKGFEDVQHQLNVLQSKIGRNDQIPTVSKLNRNNSDIMNPALIFEYKTILSALKPLKEGFYEYMDGCCACSFKKNPALS